MILAIAVALSAATPTLEIQGACPGPAQVTVQGVTPFAAVLFAAGTSTGSRNVPVGPCAGTPTGLADPALVLRQSDSDGDGIISISPNLPPAACSRHLIAIDTATCSATTPNPFSVGYTPFISYIGGTSNGSFGLGTVRDTAFDSQGNLYVSGGMSIDGYGTVGAFQPTIGGGHTDAFVASFTPAGQLRFFTYLGGPNHDRAYGMVVDAHGITLAGRAGAGFPITPGAAQSSFSGGPGGEYGEQDAFVARLSLDGSSLLWSTYLGDDGEAICRDVAVDDQGNAWCAMLHVNHSVSALTGHPGAIASTYRGGIDGGLVKLSADGTTVLHGTYIGGSGDEDGAASVQVTSDGGILYAISSDSTDGPVTPGSASTVPNQGSLDVLIVRLNADYSLRWGTLYGGSGTEASETHNLAVGADDSAYVAMYTDSPSLPGAVNANPGGSNGFVARISPDGSQVLGARFIGGAGFDEVEGIDVRNGEVAVSGGTDSWDFPTTSDGLALWSGGSVDGFVQILSADLSTVRYGTLVPSAGYDFGHAVALGPNGALLTGGSTGGFDLPTIGAWESTVHPGVGSQGGLVSASWDAGYLLYQP